MIFEAGQLSADLGGSSGTLWAAIRRELRGSFCRLAEMLPLKKPIPPGGKAPRRRQADPKGISAGLLRSTGDR